MLGAPVNKLVEGPARPSSSFNYSLKGSGKKTLPPLLLLAEWNNNTITNVVEMAYIGRKLVAISNVSYRWAKQNDVIHHHRRPGKSVIPTIVLSIDWCFFSRFNNNMAYIYSRSHITWKFRSKSCLRKTEIYRILRVIYKLIFKFWCIFK
jgi:hypothetical protein